MIGVTLRLTERLNGTIGPKWPRTIGPIVTGVSFALLMRADPQSSYWTSILPGMAVVAVGMASAVAPLTTAVLASVDERNTGAASGFSSTISRIGGLIATALAGAVISQAGAQFVGAFQGAALVPAVFAVAADLARL